MSQAGIINFVGIGPDVATLYHTDDGDAVPEFNVLNVYGVGGIVVSGDMNTITIDGSGLSPDLTITGNIGGAISPDADNWDLVTAGSTAGFVGTLGTLTLDFNINNLIIGSDAPSLVSATNSTGLGLSALSTLTDAPNNTGVGYVALSFLSSGFGENTCVGSGSLQALLTGSSNIAIGYLAGSALQGDEDDNIYIGSLGFIGEEGAIRIGTSPFQTTAYMAGITGVTVAASAPVAVSSTGQLSSLGFGTADEVLTSGGPGVSPSWQGIDDLGAVTHLTPDFGGQVDPAAGNINVFGQKTISAQTMMTSNIAGDLLIEDRTWFTAYVVDTSVAPGTRGTFATIQDAIDAIIADGVATSTDYGYIQVRQGTYSENLVVSGNYRIYIKGLTPETWNLTSQPSVFVFGTLTLNTARLYLENIGISGVTTINDGLLFCYNALLARAVGVSTGGATALRMYGGELASVNLTQFFVNLKNVGLGYNGVCTYTGCLVTAIDCYWLDSAFYLSLDGTTQASFVGCDQMMISGTTAGAVSIQNTGLQNPPNLPNCLNLEMCNNFRSGTVSPVTGGVPQDLYTLSNPNKMFPSLLGNIQLIKKVSADYVMLSTDYCIGVTSTAAPRTITLPDTGSALRPRLGQIYIIKDESGGAFMNNITVLPDGGTIDGAASYIININYGSAKFYFDGTDYFII